VFANMRSVRKGCSGVESPLFENMMQVREVDAEEEVQFPAYDAVDQENVTEEIADDVAQPTSPLLPSPVILSLPPHQSPRTSPSQATEGSSILVQQVLDKCSALVLRVEGLESGRISVDIDEGIELVDDQEKDAQEDTEVQEVVKVVNAAKLITEVVTAVATTAASIPILAVEPAVVAVSTPISVAKPAAKPKVLKIVLAAPAVSTRKRKGVVIRDPEEELNDDTPAETLSDKDKGKGILVDDPKPMKKKDQIAMDAEKVPVVNYEIVMINNKPRYKIFRADDTHQLYTSFI
nr:hypothetical protein [Tanacetum cinerariifolium]